MGRSWEKYKQNRLRGSLWQGEKCVIASKIQRSSKNAHLDSILKKKNHSHKLPEKRLSVAQISEVSQLSDGWKNRLDDRHDDDNDTRDHQRNTYTDKHCDNNASPRRRNSSETQTSPANSTETPTQFFIVLPQGGWCVNP
jgi:hypothetical protein